MEYLLIALGLMVILGLIVFVHGIRNAKEVDKNIPFLNGDYDPEEDKTLRRTIN
jgi:hypothetical protein